MTKETEQHQDDKTILLDRQGKGLAPSPLTDSVAAPRVEHLSERMIYSARSSSTEAFNTGLNSLVSAACDLLSEVVRLKHSTACADLNGLNTQLANDLKSFEARALQNGVETGQVMAARYVLCSVVDEAVVTTTWGNESKWSQMSLLSKFHNETFGGEKFFQLLTRLSRNPVKHLPMLELMYVCLSLGFEGKYRVQTRGMLELEGIRDDLYRQIRQLRADTPRELSPQWEGLNHQRRSLVRIVPAWMVALFTCVCLVVMYSGFAWVLGEQRDAVLQPYQAIDPAPAKPQS